MVGLLHQRESANAAAITTKLLDEMQREVVPGAGAGKAFGMALMLHALAEAGMQNERDAAWHWQMAQQFDPELERWDLREFGAPAEVLARHTLTADPTPDVPRIGEAGAEGIERPERIAGSLGKLASSEFTRLHGREETLILNVVIDEEGVPSHPRILQWSPDLSFALSSGESVRGFRFRPATRAGVPVAVRYSTTSRITFR